MMMTPAVQYGNVYLYMDRYLYVSRDKTTNKVNLLLPNLADISGGINTSIFTFISTLQRQELQRAN